MVKNGERRGGNTEEPDDSRHKWELHWTFSKQGKRPKFLKYGKYFPNN